MNIGPKDIVPKDSALAVRFDRVAVQTAVPHSLHVLTGSGPIAQIVLYAPPLGANLFPAFGLPPTG